MFNGGVVGGMGDGGVETEDWKSRIATLEQNHEIQARTRKKKKKTRYSLNAEGG